MNKDLYSNPDKGTGISSWIYDKVEVVVAFTVGTLMIGMSYLVIQWKETGGIKDSIFVSFLLGATLLLIQGMRFLFKYINNNSINFFACALDRIGYEEIFKASRNFCRSIFNSKFMSISGFIYGIAISSSIFLMNVWHDHHVLRLLLFIFLFVINFITGIGFYALLLFFINLLKISKIVKVDLWQRDNYCTNFFRKISRTSAILASTYICICISSILFSVIPLGSLTIGYSMFSGIVILAIFIFPEVPIRKRINEAKRKTLIALNTQIQLEFQRVLADSRSTEKELDFTKIDNLMRIKENIEKISIWPFGQKTINTIIYVILITSLPVILELILKKVFK